MSTQPADDALDLVSEQPHTSQKLPVAVIVDGYSSGQFLAGEFRSRGLASVHVRSTPTIGGADAHSFDDQYLTTLQFSGNIDSIVDQLDDYDVRCVVPGIEGASIAITDSLSARLGVPGNDPATSGARQNKADMLDALAAAGVRHIPYARASTPAELRLACEGLGSWPIVVKPLTAGNTEDVIICENADQAQRALATIIGKRNATEQVNQAVVAETFIDGDEYVVNTVSRDGCHVVTDIWLYDKRVVLGSTRVCLRMQLIPRFGEIADALVAYIGPALDALGLRNGAAHSEVFMTDTGPVLGETGARLMGGGLPTACYSEALGYTQLEALVDSMVEVSRWEAHLGQPYELRRRVEIVNLMMDRSGVVESIPGLDFLRALPSYRLEIMSVGPGDQVVPTVDGLTCPGHIVLSAADPATVEADHAALRAAEPTLFQLR